MQCPVSDKETINGVALAKGIKSTHAWLLFKLIKGSFFLGGQVYLYNKAGRERSRKQLRRFCLAGKSLAYADQRRTIMDNLQGLVCTVPEIEEKAAPKD